MPYDIRVGNLVELGVEIEFPTTVALFGMGTSSLYVPSGTVVLLLETPATEAIEAICRQINNVKAPIGTDIAYRYVKVLYEETIYEAWLGNIRRVVK